MSTEPSKTPLDPSHSNGISADSQSNNTHAHEYEDSEQLTSYLNDTTHTNPGYNHAYTTLLEYGYRYPEDGAEMSRLECERILEARAQAQRDVNAYNAQMQGAGGKTT